MKIVVVMEGGVIQHTTCDQDIELLVIDRDVEGCDKSEIKKVWGADSYVFPVHPEKCSTEEFQNLLKEIE